MKIFKVVLWAVTAALISGCQVYLGGPPAPVVSVDVGAEVVPPTYVWDGYEYVGEVNGGFYYFGPGGVWISAGPVILDRFHGWEGVHPDWRAHVIVNDRDHRIDREHRAVAQRRPAEAQRRAAPEHKAPAPARQPAPKKGQEEKKDDNR